MEKLKKTFFNDPINLGKGSKNIKIISIEFSTGEGGSTHFH